MRTVNRVAASVRGPGFAPAGKEKMLAFAKGIRIELPELGGLATRSGGAALDTDCELWRAGRARYLAVLRRYVHALRSADLGGAARCGLLGDLGFYVIRSLLTGEEEKELLEHWLPGSAVYARGSYEKGTMRRFFHYGPILLRKTELSSKSTLGITPGRLGAMPTPVTRMDLPARIRGKALGLGEASSEDDHVFDQLYVNHYAAGVSSGIAFHHDNPKTMRNVVAGVSLGSEAAMHFRVPEGDLEGAPLSVNLPRRSLYLMSGLSRYHFQHSVPRLESDRLSLTFRTVNRGCAAGYLWEREWAEIPAREAANAHWPLLTPAAVV